jgi:hypothetical protein
MYFIAGTSCLRDHRSLPCDAIQKFGWLLRVEISRSFAAINHHRHRSLRCDVPRYARCRHPRDQQRTKCLIVASSRLAMVRSLSSHAPWQYDCFSQHQQIMSSLLSRCDIKGMLVVVAFCNTSSFAVIISIDSM